MVGGTVPLHRSLIYIRQKEFRSAVGNFDPLPCWNSIGTQSLVLYGEEDTNGPSHRSVRLLRELDKPNITGRIFPGSGHALGEIAGFICAAGDQ